MPEMPSSSNGQQIYSPAYDGNIERPYLTPTFKLWIVGVIFFLIFTYLLNNILLPNVRIFSSDFVLGFALFLVAYLWLQELREKYRLQELNEELIKAQKKLQEAEVNTIASLVAMIEGSDPYVHGHSKRVARFACEIGRALEFSKDIIEVLERAAMLHDIGKFAIPEAILHKPGPLDEGEWEIVKRHPTRAVEMLRHLKFLHMEKNIILHHHERIDGQGYPRGIKGKDIPYEARVLAVANTFDTMNSNKPYRPSMAPKEIIEELKRVAGTQLDPTIVTVFLKILEKNPSFWEKSDAG